MNGKKANSIKGKDSAMFNETTEDDKKENWDPNPHKMNRRIKSNDLLTNKIYFQDCILYARVQCKK